MAERKDFDMEYNRAIELLKKAVGHIEAFEDDEAKQVLENLGFTNDELAEIQTEIRILEADRDNVEYVQGWRIHAGEVVWELSDPGADWIFSDQHEVDGGWATENVPFKNYCHYFHAAEDGRFVGYARYSETESYVEEFEDLEDCLDWLCDTDD